MFGQNASTPTGNRMIQPVVPSAFVIHTTQNSSPTAPNSSQIRRNSCTKRVHLTLDFVRGPIGFQLRLPYGLSEYECEIVSRALVADIHNEIGVRMPIELLRIDQRSVNCGLGPWRRPACLCRSFRIEASFCRAHE